MREQTLVEKGASSKVGMLLLMRGREQRAVEVKLRQKALQDERLAANNLVETKLAIAKAQQMAAEVRWKYMQQIIVNRRDAEKRKQEDILQKAWQRWLQLQYPVQLGYSCINYYEKKSKNDKN